MRGLEKGFVQHHSFFLPVLVAEKSKALSQSKPQQSATSKVKQSASKAQAKCKVQAKA